MTVGVEFSEVYREVLDMLPNEAYAALLSGEEWEYKPDSIEYATDYPWYCDDCDSFHHSWIVYGYAVHHFEGPKLYRTIWSVDESGDWDLAALEEVGTEGEDEAIAYHGLGRSEAAWQRYFEFVRDRGIEPLGEYLAPAPQRVRWEFFAEVRDDGLHLLHARPMGDDYPRNLFLSPHELPDHARQFFCYETPGSLICGPEEVDAICTPEGDAVRHRVGNVLYGQDDISTPEAPETYRERVVEWANKQLERSKKEVSV